MSRKQLVALVICNLGLFVMGNMAWTLLPVYATQLGMDEATIGIYLGLAFVAITVGALSSGWFSERFQRRKLTMILVSVLGVPATFMMGQVDNLALLTCFTLIVWFATGLASAMVTILTGLNADPRARGRIFGSMASSASLGIALGAFMAGAVVERWGFMALYSLTALVWLIPIVAALFIQDTAAHAPAGQPKSAAAPLSRALWLLFLGNILVTAASFSSLLARPLMMNKLGFDHSAIASAASIGALVALPLPILIGWLSDRTGRRQLLIAGYVLMTIGTLTLVSALNLWQFWASASLFTFAGSLTSVGNAFVTDLAPPDVLGTALSRFSATQWIGAVLGYMTTGVAIQGLGITNALLLVAALPVVSVLVMLYIGRRSVQLVPA